MAIKIAVMSPLYNMGTTTVTALLTHAEACKGRSALMCYTSPESPIKDYLGIEKEDDPTRSIMLVTKLIDSGALSDNEVLQFATKFDPKRQAYLLDTADKTLDERSRQQIVSYVFQHVDTDVVFCDVSEDIQDEGTQALLDAADGVFLVVQPSPKCLARARSWLESEWLQYHEHVYVIINQYNEVIDSARGIYSKLGIAAATGTKLHYNPYITKFTMNHGLDAIAKSAIGLDPRTVQLNNDFNEIDEIVVAIGLGASSVKKHVNPVRGVLDMLGGK